MAGIHAALLAAARPGRLRSLHVGANWTAVVVETGAGVRCGLAATLARATIHRGEFHPTVPQSQDALELAAHALSDDPLQRSLGWAALNALLPDPPGLIPGINAEALLARLGRGKRVVMVGHFPFAGRLAPQVGELLILERDPQPGDLPADAAPQVLPAAEVVAITAMALVNGSLPGVLAHCAPDAFCMLLGPSTPLSPELFEFGLSCLSGAQVEALDPVLRLVEQGADFRQLHPAGVRLVSLMKPAAV